MAFGKRKIVVIAIEQAQLKQVCHLSGYYVQTGRHSLGGRGGRLRCSSKNLMFTRFLLFLLIALAPVGAQKAEAPKQDPAPARPNFSGRWRMVKAKSEFNGFKVPDVVIRVVDHHDPMVNLHTVQTTDKQTSMSDVTYFTDGALTMNTIKGRDAQSKGFWDGAVLVIRTKMLMANGEREVIEDRWELSADGKTLTTASQIATEKGDAHLTMVCEKEEPQKRP